MDLLKRRWTALVCAVGLCAGLTLPASVDATSLSLKSDDGTITGINGVEVSAGADAPVYDLQGRRLPQVPEKGIYIQNGKKIMK